MAKCKTCSAPLPSNGFKCAYCGTKNEIDLHSIHEYTVTKPEVDRICPRCSKPMLTVDLKIKGKFYIERCEKCQGLFFDPGELDVLLESSVSNVFSIDYNRIKDLNKDYYSKKDFEVVYLKCPVCRKLMNRQKFGTRSGVIIDTCGSHGVWLDVGELRHILEWKKAGGALLDKIRKEERKKEEEQKEKVLNRSVQKRNIMSGSSFYAADPDAPLLSGGYILDSVVNLVLRLFSR